MKVYDKDIRSLLLKKFTMLKSFTMDPTTIIIHEMDVCFGCARIDIAVINGKMHGYEIKSEQDNLDRLPSQIELYNRIFDTLTIVTTEKHYQKVTELVPEWWGIYCVTQAGNKLALITKRKPKQNKQINIINLTQNLWKDELLEILRKNGINKGVKSKSRFELGKILAKQVDPVQIKDFVRDRLKSRTSSRVVQLRQLCDGLPL